MSITRHAPAATYGNAAVLTLDTVIGVHSAGMNEGSLVRLGPPTSPPTYGVGGLVWVDGETKRAIVPRGCE